VATSVLVSDIMEEARVRLDYDDFSTTSYVTTTMALNWVKFGARRLSSLIRWANSDYFLTLGTVTTTASVSTVSLPSNFTDLRQIAWLRAADESVPLRMASVDDYLAAGESVKAWDAPPLYRLHGSTLRFFPTPSDTYTVSLYYDTGIFVTATSDSIDAQPGWDEWLIQDFMVKALEREEKDSTESIRMKMQIEEEIVAQAKQRDRFSTFQVRDTWGSGEFVDDRSLFWRR